MENKYLKINPVITELLKGTPIPYQSYKDITNRETTSLAIFSDYSGSSPGAQFETFAHYIVDWNDCGRLYERLIQIKGKYNISERRIDYKGRKDNMKFKAFLEWIQAVREFPGLLYVLMFDKSLYEATRHSKGELLADLKSSDLDGNLDVALRTVKVISLFSPIGHMLDNSVKVIWVSDEDEIFHGEKRTDGLEKSIGYLADEVIGKKLEGFGYCTPLHDIHEELLCIPDLIAGALAHCSKYDEQKGFYWNCPDEQTSIILNEFAGFGNALKNDQSVANIGVYFFEPGTPFKLGTLDLSKTEVMSESEDVD